MAAQLGAGTDRRLASLAGGGSAPKPLYGPEERQLSKRKIIAGGASVGGVALALLGWIQAPDCPPAFYPRGVSVRVQCSSYVMEYAWGAPLLAIVALGVLRVRSGSR